MVVNNEPLIPLLFELIAMSLMNPFQNSILLFTATAVALAVIEKTIEAPQLKYELFM